MAWASLNGVINDNVLGIHRPEKWRILIDDMLEAFHTTIVKPSRKIHFSHCHIENFAEQSTAESDEHDYQVTARLEHG